MENIHAIVVDDDINTTTVLSKIVASHGYTVTTADSLAAARKRFSERKPDLMLVDVMLPDGNGVDLIEELYSDPSIKFVVITGHPSVKVAVQALKAHVYDFLEKPIQLTEIRELLKRATTEQDAQIIPHNTNAINEPLKLLGKTFWQVEKELIFATLEHHNGDKEQTAKTLGISLKTLYNRLHAYS